MKPKSEQKGRDPLLSSSTNSDMLSETEWDFNFTRSFQDFTTTNPNLYDEQQSPMSPLSTSVDADHNVTLTEGHFLPVNPERVLETGQRREGAMDIVIDVAGAGCVQQAGEQEQVDVEAVGNVDEELLENVDVEELDNIDLEVFDKVTVEAEAPHKGIEKIVHSTMRMRENCDNINGTARRVVPSHNQPANSDNVNSTSQRQAVPNNELANRNNRNGTNQKRAAPIHQAKLNQANRNIVKGTSQRLGDHQMQVSSSKQKGTASQLPTVSVPKQQGSVSQPQPPQVQHIQIVAIPSASSSSSQLAAFQSAHKSSSSTIILDSNTGGTYSPALIGLAPSHSRSQAHSHSRQSAVQAKSKKTSLAKCGTPVLLQQLQSSSPHKTVPVDITSGNSTGNSVSRQTLSQQPVSGICGSGSLGVGTKSKYQVFTTRNENKEFPKPVYSYSCLVGLALKNSKTKYLPVSDIYNFMCEHFPYFKTAADGWKNSVRHNLSLNKCFAKHPKSNGDKKGCLWKIDEAQATKMDSEIVKWRKKDPRNLLLSMAYPEKLAAIERGEEGMPFKVSALESDEEGEDNNSQPAPPPPTATPTTPPAAATPVRRKLNLMATSTPKRENREEEMNTEAYQQQQDQRPSSPQADQLDHESTEVAEEDVSWDLLDGEDINLSNLGNLESEFDIDLFTSSPLSGSDSPLQSLSNSGSGGHHSSPRLIVSCTPTAVRTNLLDTASPMNSSAVQV